MIGRNQIAFPEFERPTPHRRLVSDGSHNEPAIGFEIIVLKEFLPALQREIGAVDEILVKLVAVRVDVVNTILVLAIYYEQNVRQGVRRVRVVNNGE